MSVAVHRVVAMPTPFVYFFPSALCVKYVQVQIEKQRVKKSFDGCGGVKTVHERTAIERAKHVFVPSAFVFRHRCCVVHAGHFGHVQRTERSIPGVIGKGGINQTMLRRVTRLTARRCIRSFVLYVVREMLPPWVNATGGTKRLPGGSNFYFSEESPHTGGLNEGGGKLLTRLLPCTYSSSFRHT